MRPANVLSVGGRRKPRRPGGEATPHRALPHGDGKAWSGPVNHRPTIVNDLRLLPIRTHRRPGGGQSGPVRAAPEGHPVRRSGTALGYVARRLIPNTPLGFRLIDHREAILRAAAHRHASNVRVFGSVARGEDRPESDIDLLVDLGPAAIAFDLLELGCDLEDELNVRVDVGTESSLRPFLRAEVLAEALTL